MKPISKLDTIPAMMQQSTQEDTSSEGQQNYKRIIADLNRKNLELEK